MKIISSPLFCCIFACLHAKKGKNEKEFGIAMKLLNAFLGPPGESLSWIHSPGDTRVLLQHPANPGPEGQAGTCSPGLNRTGIVGVAWLEERA